jgi:hypothetical protein
MSGRLFFGLITVFWLTMNMLLWRMEWGGGQEPADQVPLPVLWRKIFTAPDYSAMEVFHRGKSLGFCRWMPEVREERQASAEEVDGFAPEGRVVRPTTYAVDCEGSILVSPFTNRLKFNLQVVFDTNFLWRDLIVRVGMRPQAWEVRASALKEVVELKFENHNVVWDQRFRFDELRDPSRLLDLMGIGWLGDACGVPLSTNIVGQLSLGLTRVAYQDWLKVGHARVRGYRLKVRLFDRHQILVLVSRIGEILRVELPGEITLANEIMTAL